MLHSSSKIGLVYIKPFYKYQYEKVSSQVNVRFILLYLLLPAELDSPPRPYCASAALCNFCPEDKYCRVQLCYLLTTSVQLIPIQNHYMVCFTYEIKPLASDVI